MSSKKNVYTLGEFKDDQIQNITGGLSRNTQRADSEATGCFSFSNATAYSYENYQSTGAGRNANLSFDASSVARTGTTTHQKSLGVNYIIKF